MTNQIEIVGQVQPLPKRRRSDDNPYRLTLTIDSSGTHHYYVRFIDSTGQNQCLEIDHSQFEAFDSFERDDLHDLNEKDRHIDGYADINDATEKSSCAGPEEVEQERFNAELEIKCLYLALSMLTDTQKRRIQMYYFQNMTYQEIAMSENCNIASIGESINSAKRNLQNNYKKIFSDDPEKWIFSEVLSEGTFRWPSSEP